MIETTRKATETTLWDSIGWFLLFQGLMLCTRKDVRELPRNKRVKQKVPNAKKAGPDYEPYLTVRDVPSTGVSTRSTHPKMPWVTQELSGIETALRLILEWSDDVKAVREQFPLDLDETLLIAEQLGIKHATFGNTDEPKVMTSDFIITMTNDETVVVQTKSWNGITVREVEKLEIERTYWRKKGVPWIIVTNLEIPSVFITNILFIRKYMNISDYNVTEKQAHRVRRVAEPLIFDNTPLMDIGEFTDEKLGYELGTSLTVFKHLIATKQWIVDMYQPIDPGERLLILEITDNDREIREVRTVE